mgnify:CR=1 FL=1
MFIKRNASKLKGKKAKYPTLTIVESKRGKDGKPRHVQLLHLGREDKFMEKDLDTLLNGLLKLKGPSLDELTEEFDSSKSIGQIWAFMELWKQLKVSQTIARLKKKTKIEIDLDDYLKALVFNRLDDPGSKLRLISWLETVYLPGIKTQDIKYENLLRTMDFLIKHKQQIEDQIAYQYLTLFDSHVKICFYDITSTYFEAEASICNNDIRQNGYSRDSRSDRRQIVIGVVMTQDGIPIAHYTFQGNTVDSKTVQPVLEDIKKRFGVENITIVADKGMSGGNNLKALIDNGDDFILGESAKTSKVGKEAVNLAFQAKEKEDPEADEFVYDTVLTKEIFYHEPLDEDNLIRKSVEKEIRYVASYNKKVAKKKHLTRQENFAKTYEFVSQINRKQISIDDKYADIKNFLKKKHMTRFFDIVKHGDEIEISEKTDNLRNEEKSDGWFVVITLNKERPKEKVIEKYKELKYVEHGFAELKHSIKLRPNFHWTENRINAHVMVCFVAFQLACLFEKRIKSLEMSWEKAVHKLRQIHVIEWTIKDRHRKGLTKTTDVQQDIFNLLGCQKLSVNKL